MVGPNGGPPEPPRRGAPAAGRSGEWSMVVIRDSAAAAAAAGGGRDGGKDGSLSVFPPSDHENLHVPSGPCGGEGGPSPVLASPLDSLSSPSQFFTSSPSASSSSSCSSSFSSSDVDEELQDEPRPLGSAVQVSEPGRHTGLLEFGFRVLGSKAFAAVSSFFGRSSARGGMFWLSVASAAAVLWWVYTRFRLLRMGHRERVDGLMLVIKERDEKIARLLHQIAQMNEVLLSRHKALISKLPG
ncbi:hypothetical protein ACJRO7_008180 [Eucalyptus globulus]|uniref:Uncharacterized protein n=1 Tax=Eucalyptus globulus TaxID=34317 RepID=A0ABD3IQC9_EUCGL